MTLFAALARPHGVPRRPRNWEPGAILHVDARAHDGAPFFAQDEDRAFVVERARRVFEEEGVVCLGWAILVNHYHLLARFPAAPRRPMHRLNTAIARRLRRRFGGRGAVFQDRYFSSPCEDSRALLMRLAYVVANPIHHHVVDSVGALVDHRWSSLGEMTGRRPPRLVNVEASLDLIDGPREGAVEGLLDLISMRVRMWREEDAARPAARDSSVDGPLDVARNVSAASEPSASPHPVVDPSAALALRDRLRAVGWSPAALIAAACDLTGATPAAIRLGRRQRAVSRARSIVAYVACERLAWPPGEVAMSLGISGSSLMQARARGDAALKDTGVPVAEMLRRAGISI